MSDASNIPVSRLRRSVAALVDIALCLALVLPVSQLVIHAEENSVGRDALNKIADWKAARSAAGVFDYPFIEEAPAELQDAFRRSQKWRNILLVAMVVTAGVYHVGFESSRWKKTPGKWLAGLVVSDVAGEKITATRATWRFFLKLLNACIWGCPLFFAAVLLMQLSGWLGIIPAILFVPLLFTRFTRKSGPIHDALSRTIVYRMRGAVAPAHGHVIATLMVCLALTGCSGKEQEAKRKEEAEIKAVILKAEQGDVEAQKTLGRAYCSDGLMTWYQRPFSSLPVNFHEGVQWWRKAALQGDAEAQFDLAALLENGKPARTAGDIARHREMASGGSRDLNLIDWSSVKPHAGFPADPAEAARWYRKAAETGHSRSQLNLGRMYSRGRGVNRDEIVALHWLLRCEGGEPEARDEAERLRASLTAEQVGIAERLAGRR